MMSGTPKSYPQGIMRSSKGKNVGRDPREMTESELTGMGHERMPLLKAIRAKCLDCCCGQDTEVRKCTATDCPLWPYRMKKNPFSRRTGNPEALAKARAIAA